MSITYVVDYPPFVENLLEYGNKPAGLDTEFYGVVIGKESAYARAKIHLISVALSNSQYNPRGYFESDTYVLLSDALQNSEFRAWLQSDRPKCVHNLPVDAHSLQNHGITLGGGLNTLALARFTWPERASRFGGGGFTLDALGRDFCGTGKTEDFESLFSEECEVIENKTRMGKACECGIWPCSKRANTEGHMRYPREISYTLTKTVTRPVPLESVVPGHRLWERAVRYAAVDAYLALAIYQIAQRKLEKQIRRMPW